MTRRGLIPAFIMLSLRMVCVGWGGGDQLWAMPLDALNPPPPSTANSAANSSANGLAEGTVGKDIQTSDYYALIAWAKRLGISTQGSRPDLIQRLYEYYGLKPPEITPPSGTSRIITIDSATESSYFKIEQPNEQYLKLSGRVHLRMDDRKTGDLHDIEADEVIFNQTENLLTARGHIVYSITHNNGQKEVFHGDGLTFRLDTWDGFFISGASTSPRQVNGETFDFTFSGDYISRSADDTVVMDNGTVTSSKATPPNYELRARRIWILQSGEWGVEDAFLDVGRVPVFYIPYFFKPGRQLVMHPALGYRPREGTYLQTTTYLIGQKPDTTSPLSFLQVTNNGDTNVPKKLDGLFLKPVPQSSSSSGSSATGSAAESTATAGDQSSPAATSAAGSRPAPAAAGGNQNVPATAADTTGWALKALADIYSRLGEVVGLVGDFPKIAKQGELNFAAEIAGSRNLYLDTYGNYSPRFVASDGTIASHWNSSWLFGTELPFRYYFDLEGKYTTTPISLALQLPLFSDPYFQQDFGDRSEDIDWANLLGIAATQTTTPAAISSYTWQFTSGFAIPPDSLPAAAKTLAISRLNSSLSFQSQLIPIADLPQYDTSVNGQTLDRSPDSAFFYPDLLTLPDVGLHIAGTIVSYPPSPASSTGAGSGSSSGSGSTAATANPTGAGAPRGTSAGSGASGQGAAGSSAGSGAQPQPPQLSPPWDFEAALPGGTPTSPDSVAAGTPGSGGAPTASAAAAANATAPSSGSSTQEQAPGGRSPAPSGSSAPATSSPASTQAPDELPPIRPDLPTVSPPRPIGFSLTYDISPGLLLQGHTDSPDWTLPSQINLAMQYWSLESRDTASLAYSADALNQFAALQGGLTLSAQYRSLFKPGSSNVSNWDSLNQQAYAFSGLSVTDQNRLTTKPLQSIPILADSTLSYSLATLLLQRAYDGLDSANNPLYANTFAAWDTQHVTTNLVDLLLSANLLSASQTLHVSYSLPPVTQQFAAGITLHTGPLQHSLSTSVTFPGAVATFAPVVLQETLSIGTLGQASDTVQYDPTQKQFTSDAATLGVGPLSVGVNFNYTNGYNFVGFPTGWVANTDNAFQLSSVNVGLVGHFAPDPFWKNRISVSGDVNSRLQMNTLRFTDSNFSFSLNLTISIADFLKLTFSSVSSNSVPFLYVPAYANELGLAWRNPLVDLLKSFNFFNIADRRASAFKLQQLSVGLSHDLGDWTLTASYAGKPVLGPSPTGIGQQYSWVNTFDVSIQWKPIPEIKRDVGVDQSGTLNLSGVSATGTQ